MKILRLAPILVALILILLPTGLISFTAAATPCSDKDEELFTINLSFDLFAPLEIDDAHCRVDTLTHKIVDTDLATVVDKVHPLQLTPTSRVALFAAQDTIGNFAPPKQVPYTGSNPLYLQNASLLI